MKCLLLIVLLATSAFADTAEKCTEKNCDKAKGCFCATKSSPIDVAQTPQFVVLTFDDAMQDAIYKTYYEPLLFSRKNPDGSPISATFFVQHEYSDYTKVNSLYNKGFEIGVHSITNNPLTSYWQEASVETLIAEFQGQRQIISKFANIPIDDIIGARVPNLALAGNKLFEAYSKSGLKYDNSWSSLSGQKYFPYTLDYVSPQQCFHNCPTEAFKGFWISPIINLKGKEAECNAILGCQVTGTVEEIKNWLVEQFEKFYKNKRAPMTLMLNSAWFQFDENSLEALAGFLDHLATLKDAYVVSHSHVLEWMAKPVPVASYKPAVPKRSAKCSDDKCQLEKPGEGLRYMNSCSECPDQFPWLNNPQGEKTLL